MVHISDKNGDKFVEWIVISADNEKQAIDEATTMLRLYILPWML
jgi:hypothetical protein